MDNIYCRFCAESKPSDKLIDLQVDIEKLELTMHRLEYVNVKNVDIIAENSLPKTVCILCYDFLNKTYDFLTKVQNAQEVLTQIFTQRKDKLDDSDEDGVDFDDIAPPPDFAEPSDPEKKAKIKLEIAGETDPQKRTTTDSFDTIKLEPKVFVKNESEHNPVSNVLDLNVQDIIDAAIGSSESIESTIQWQEADNKEESWKNYSWVCKYCYMEFPDMSVLRLHCKEVHGNCFGFFCVDCNTNSTTFDGFIEHVREHRKYLRERCPYCDEILMHGKAHIAQHFLKSKVSCKNCGEILKNEDTLKQHTLRYATHLKRKPRRKRGEPVTVDDLTCPICNKVYKTRNSLRDHQKLHTDERKRNYTCDRCGKAFFNKGTLTSHIMSHDKNRPHVCKICNNSFLYPNMLRRHVQMHSGIKPFSCEQCGRTFRLQYQLKAHKIIHTNQMPYMCQFCSKSFRFKQILKSHERQHTGVKPYLCEMCPLEFTNWSNYNKHMKRRHNLDTAKKKITPIGTFPVNPATGQLVGIDDPVAMEEWKSKIMVPGKRGKKKKIKNERESFVVSSPNIATESGL